MRKRVAFRDELSGEQWKDTTVPCGLKSLIICDWRTKLIEMISEDVEVVSEVFIKFAVYFDRICLRNREKPSFFRGFADRNKFRDIFLKFKSSEGQIRKSIKFSLKSRSELLLNSGTDFQTAVENNIKMNLRRRLIRFYKYIDVRDHPEDFVEELLDGGFDDINFPGVRFADR